MSRNSSGVYSLYTPGNPVVTNTTISSAWANNTLSDIATAMTDSLSRSNLGGMLAQLQLFDGAIGAPGLSWATESTTGLYRKSAGVFAWALGGNDVFNFNATGITFTRAASPLNFPVAISSTIPGIWFNETDAAANNRSWDFVLDGELLLFRVGNDAGSAFVNWLAVNRTLNIVDSIDFTSTTASFSGQTLFTAIAADGAVKISSAVPDLSLNESDGAANNRLWRYYVNGEQLNFDACNDALSVASSWLTVDRTGTTIDIVNFPNGILQYNGVEVAKRYITGASKSATYPIASSDSNTVVRAGAGCGQLTINSVTLGTTVTIVNESGGNVNLVAGTGAIFWFPGAGGRVGPANRVFADGAAATLVCIDGTNWFLWGNGIS